MFLVPARRSSYFVTKALFQPSLVKLLKGKVGLGRIDNFGARVNTSFSGIRLDQGWANPWIVVHVSWSSTLQACSTLARCSGVIPAGRAIEISCGTSPRAMLAAKRSRSGWTVRSSVWPRWTNSAFQLLGEQVEGWREVGRIDDALLVRRQVSGEASRAFWLQPRV
jgi:hypothetical protein